jgi:hypothetical protein
MHLEQLNKHHTNYGILVSLANEKAQTSIHMLVSLQKHRHIVVDCYTYLVTMCQ